MPSVSRAQRRYMGMVEALKKGELRKPKQMSATRWRRLRRRLQRTAAGMTETQVTHYSRTPEDGLPARARKRR